VGLKGPWELPEGWRWVRLGKIAKLTSGGTPSRKIKEYWENGTIPWVKSGELEDNVIYTTEEKITERGLKESSAKMFPKGTLLVALYGATVGKTAILGIDATTNQAVCAVLPPNRREAEWDARYLQYYFIAIRPMLISKSGGGAQPNIYLHTLRRLEIPLPPLSEQKRIVAKLNEVSKRLEEAKHLAREAREEAERLMASALHEVFSKAEEKGWEWVRLGKIAELKAGGTPSRRVREYWKNGTIPWVKISDIPDSGLVEKTEEKITELGLKNSSAKLLPPGTILFSIFATISKVGILKISATTNQAIVGIIPKITIDQKYLFYSLKYFGQELVALGRGGVQDNINKRMLAKLKTPLPPLEEQQRIVAYLDSINEHAQKLVSLYEEREKELEQLFPAVLDRAFRGEL